MINYDILLTKKGDTMPKIKIKYEVTSKSSDLNETYHDSKEVDAILENDKIKLTSKKSQDSFIRLLNDDFLYSQLSKINYETKAKNRIR